MLSVDALMAATLGAMAETAGVALEDQTLSALSKMAAYVVAENSSSAMWFRTVEGRDRRQIPSTVSAQ